MQSWPCQVFGFVFSEERLLRKLCPASQSLLCWSACTGKFSFAECGNQSRPGCFCTLTHSAESLGMCSSWVWVCLFRALFRGKECSQQVQTSVRLHARVTPSDPQCWLCSPPAPVLCSAGPTPGCGTVPALQRLPGWGGGEANQRLCNFESH